MDNPVIFILLGVIVLGGGLALATGLLKRNGGGVNQDEFRSKWLAINASVSKDNPASWQVGLMDADKLLDAALIASGVKGTTLGERLKAGRGKFSKLDAVWGAHKLRNRLAHEPDAKISYPETVRALAVFKQALKDLGAI